MKGKFWLILLLLVVLDLAVFLAAIRMGVVENQWQHVFDSFFRYDANDQSQQIIRNLRLPRVLGGFLIGGAFAVTGALMQGITRNPLADSGLLGINGGASLGLVAAFILFPDSPVYFPAILSFAGAAVAAGLIFLILRFSPTSMQTAGLILAGVAIGSFFSSLSQSLSLSFNLNQDLTFWLIGGVANITWLQLRVLLPIFVIILCVSCLLGNSVNALLLGDDAALALGKHPFATRGLVLLIVMVLAGLSVSLVGPISFVGLIVPHVLRGITGENYRRLLPLSILGGGLLVMLADLAARLVNPPFETPFGLVIAVIGVPFLLFQVRRLRG